MIPLEHAHLSVRETPVGSTWKHKRSGKAYTVTGHVMLEATWSPGVVYRGTEHSFDIVRDADEFTDGRFERIENA